MSVRTSPLQSMKNWVRGGLVRKGRGLILKRGPNQTNMSKSWQDVMLPVGQGLESCIHVAWVSNILHPCQSFKQEKPKENTHFRSLKVRTLPNVYSYLWILTYINYAKQWHLYWNIILLVNSTDLDSRFNVPLGFSSSSSDSEPSSSATAIGTPFSGWPAGWVAAS